LKTADPSARAQCADWSAGCILQVASSDFLRDSKSVFLELRLAAGLLNGPKVPIKTLLAIIRTALACSRVYLTRPQW